MKKKGLTAEQAVGRILEDSLAEINESRLRKLASSVYSQADNTSSPTNLSKTSVGMAELNEFMGRRYLFRRNSITGLAEYIERGKYKLDFRPVTSEVINSITLNAREEGIDVWNKDVERFLHSNRVCPYNPFDVFLEGLPQWDKRRRIDKHFRRIPSADEEWYALAHTWFLGMVALWMGRNRNKGNESILILVGPQGIGKSTFFRSLLPPQLVPYFTENFSLGDRRKALLMLTRYGLINFDEINRITVRQQPVLKNMLQLPVVDEFKPYASTSRLERRYASFAGTSNDEAVVDDLTGSRRYICTVCNGKIDMRRPVNYPQLYAEAVWEINNGIRYWLDEKEEQALMERNMQFVRMPPVAERFDALFQPVSSARKEGVWLYATQIYQQMYPHIHKEMTKKQAYDLSTILQNRGIERKRAAGGMKYYVKERGKEG